MKNVLLISASNSEPSINYEILQEILKKRNYDSLNLLKYSDLPILAKFKTVPDEIHEIHSLLASYQILVFFAPEHNGYISAFFKNILDWLSQVQLDFLKNKEVLFVSASTTERNERIMEAGVQNTFMVFNPKSFTFINVNKYGKGIQESSEKIKNIFEKLSLFI